MSDAYRISKQYVREDLPSDPEAHADSALVAHPERPTSAPCSLDSVLLDPFDGIHKYCNAHIHFLAHESIFLSEPLLDLREDQPVPTPNNRGRKP